MLKIRHALLLAAWGLVLWPQGSVADWFNDLGLVKFNQELSELWELEGKKRLEEALVDGITKLEGQKFESGKNSVTIEKVKEVKPKVEAAPGFGKLDYEGIELDLPLAGFWSVKTKIQGKIKQKVLFFTLKKSFEAKVKLSAVRATAKVDLDASDPEAPKLSAVHPPEVSYKLTITTNKWYLNLLLIFLQPKLEAELQDAIDEAIASITPKLDALVGQPADYGKGGPSVSDSGEPTDYLGAALAISDKIAKFHLPYKTLVETSYSKPYYGTWQESFADPAFDSGEPVSYGGFGDSAIWTGHYLAAEAFRHAVTKDPAALANAHTVLDGITMLTEMKGIPGLLNRSVQPAALYPPSPDNYVLPYKGDLYVMHDFISRDQYQGVFLGLGAAYDMIDDAEAKAKAQVNIERMLDYLLENKWVAYKKDGSISSIWHVQPIQQLAWLRTGVRVNSPKYIGAFLEHMPLADLAWMPVWLETFDPIKNSYYKFNLAHGSYFAYLRQETIPFLWERAYKGLKILRKSIGHHQNAHFNMCEAGAVGFATAERASETRELLRLWLKRSRRQIPGFVTDPSVEIFWYEPLSTGGLLGSAGTGLGDTEAAGWMAKVPIPVPLRTATDFLWQRSSFHLGYGYDPGVASPGGDPHAESPSADYILPYWMGRHYGVFP